MNQYLPDYEFEPETVELMAIFRAGGDAIESQRPWGHHPQILSDYVWDMEEPAKGLVVIDLVTLVHAMESAILAMKMKEFDGGSTH